MTFDRTDWARRLLLRLVPAGVVSMAAGFVVLAVAWGAAADETVPALQLPYLVSGGGLGLGLIVVGAAAVVLSVREADARAREQELVRIEALLVQLLDGMPREETER